MRLSQHQLHADVRFASTTQMLTPIQSALSGTTRETYILCANCSTTLGTYDAPTSGYRIWKWNIDVGHNSSPDLYRHVYSTPKWISARLLYLIENTGLRKFHIHPTPPYNPIHQNNNDDALNKHNDNTTPSASTPTPPRSNNPTPSLLLWVFTPDLLFSSSIPSEGRSDPTRAMKVFYQPQTWSPLKPGEPESATIEDVEFPEQLFEDLRRTLEESQGLLPATARVFQGWSVGLLERFGIGDVGGDGDKEKGKGKEGRNTTDESVKRGREGKEEWEELMQDDVD